MYRLQDQGLAYAGGGGATPRFPTARAPFGSARQAPRARELPSRTRDFELVVDLGKRIGSRDWFRGLATCAALCYAAFSFLPSFATVPGLTPAPLTGDRYEEMRVLGIAPLANGGDSGRRMAPTDAVQPLANPPERPIVDLRSSIAAPGDFTGALTRAGVSQGEAAEIATMVARVIPLDQIGAGTVIDLRLGRRASPSQPRPVERLAFRATMGLRINIERLDDRFVLNRIAIAVDETPLRIQGMVGTSLYRSARAAGVPARIVEAYIRALSTQIGVPSGIGATDRFDIIVSHRRAETGETEVGELLYAGLNRSSGRALRIMPWTQGGETRWYEASGVGRETGGGYRAPVAGRMTSPFGRRIHPILRYARMHTGIDFGAPTGAPIVAAADGQVILAGWDGGYGRAVRINHGNGMTTVYGHMSRIATANGQSVRAGQLIGYVGSTGLSTGPHLHFEVRRNNVPVNPAGFRFESRPQLSGGELAAFRGRMQALLGLPVGTVAAQPVQNASVGPVTPTLPTVPLQRPTPQPADPRQPAPQRGASW